jgi:hypothetical protein
VSVGHATLRRSYAIHGIGVEVLADDPAVIDAIDLRLRGFRGGDGPDSRVRLQFDTGGPCDDDRCAPPASERRAVYDTPHGSLFFVPDADALCGELGGVRLRCEPSRGTALLRSAAFTGRELYLATHPLVTISLMEIFERRMLFSLHAACLAGADGEGVLLAGASGAGKSTLALVLAAAGMSFLSDDVVFLTHGGGPAVRVLGFADAVGVSERAAQHFGELRAVLDERSAEGFPKRLTRVEDLLGAPVLGSCEPRALVFPEVVRDQRSEIAPLDPREALLRLVPDVLLTDPTSTQAHLRAIASLLDQVRCFELRSGTDLERAAELVRELV